MEFLLRHILWRICFNNQFYYTTFQSLLVRNNNYVLVINTEISVGLVMWFQPGLSGLDSQFVWEGPISSLLSTSEAITLSHPWEKGAFSKLLAPREHFLIISAEGFLGKQKLWIKTCWFWWLDCISLLSQQNTCSHSIVYQWKNQLGRKMLINKFPKQNNKNYKP